jgi:hypothetical protein
MPRHNDYDDDDDEPLYTQSEVEDALAQMREAAFERGRKKGRELEARFIRDGLLMATEMGMAPAEMRRLIRKLTTPEKATARAG